LIFLNLSPFDSGAAMRIVRAFFRRTWIGASGHRSRPGAPHPIKAYPDKRVTKENRS